MSLESRALPATFDALALAYDASFTQTKLGSVLRRLVWARADALFEPGSTVLDLGCGTGEDAVHLARRGVRVVGIDPSQSMIDVARAKATRTGVKVDLFCLNPEELRETFAARSFDGVVANFGAVNCIADIARLVEDLGLLCRPQAHLLWVVMGRFVPWEWAWYLAQGKFAKARRRLDTEGVDWRGMRIRYPTPSSLARSLQPTFSTTQVAPLGFFLPPSYAGAWLERRPRAFDTLASLERRAQRWRPLAHLADHFIIEARRTR